MRLAREVAEAASAVFATVPFFAPYPYIHPTETTMPPMGERCVRASKLFLLPPFFTWKSGELSSPPKREAKESEEEGRKESTMWEKWNSRVGCFERNRTDGGRVQSVENLPHSFFFSFATVGMGLSDAGEEFVCGVQEGERRIPSSKSQWTN